MLKNIIGLAAVILVAANVFLFISSIKLGDNVANFEKETKKIHQQNIELEKDVAHYDSIQFAASAAAELDFTKKEAPIYLENLRYALNR